MSYFPTTTIKKYGDSESVDSFGRLRTSTPFTLFDSKQIVDNQQIFHFVTKSIGGGTITWNSGRASSTLAVTTASGSRAIRQTRIKMTYQPGKSLLTDRTFVFGTGSAGVIKRVGYLTDSDGVFLEQSGTNINLVLRSTINGVFSENRVSQSAWNIDKYDGTGPNLVTAFDPTKIQIFHLDWQWLGGGRVRAGFYDVSGGLGYVHQFLHANQASTVYTKTPNLPIRAEVENVGGTTSNSLEIVCATAASEGGFANTGILRAADNGTTALAIGNGNLRPLVTIRLSSSAVAAGVGAIPDHINILCTTTTTNYRYALILNPVLSGSDLASWQSLSGSVVQYDTSRTNLIAGGLVLDTGYSSVGGSSAGLSSANIEFLTTTIMGADVDGNSDEVTLAVQPIGSAASFLGSLSWREF